VYTNFIQGEGVKTRERKTLTVRERARAHAPRVRENKREQARERERGGGRGMRMPVCTCVRGYVCISATKAEPSIAHKQSCLSGSHTHLPWVTNVTSRSSGGSKLFKNEACTRYCTAHAYTHTHTQRHHQYFKKLPVNNV